MIAQLCAKTDDVGLRFTEALVVRGKTPPWSQIHGVGSSESAELMWCAAHEMLRPTA
jgi:hypothetical protein